MTTTRTRRAARSLPTTVTELKQRNASNGGYWFTPDTMRWFKSRVQADVFVGQSYSYFVSSERQDWDSPRLFTVRAMGADGRVVTVGDFQQYASRTAALGAARRHAAKACANARASHCSPAGWSRIAHGGEAPLILCGRHASELW